MSITTEAPAAAKVRPVREVLAHLHQLLGELNDSAAAGTDAERVAQLGDVRRAVTRLQAVELRFVSAAQSAGVADKTGHADTGAWLAKTTRTDGRDAAQSVKLADALDRRLPATRQALGDGMVSREHAAVIDHITRQLPRTLTSSERAQVEASLVAKAQTMDPRALRRAGKRALAAVEPDEATVDAHEDQEVRSEEDRAWDRARITVRDNGDGTSTGHFIVPTLAASILERVLHSLSSPRRARPGATAAQAGEASPDATGPAWDRRLGQAFAEILEHLPTDRIHGKTAATVVVTIDHEQLAEKLKAAKVDTGDVISAGAARRLACGAGLLPAVLGRRSQIIDLGYTARLFSEAQRTALATRYTGCAADGCERPFSWCELHHRVPWSRGGSTNLADAIPVCRFHHGRIHHPDYTHRERPGPDGLPVIAFAPVTRRQPTPR